MKHFSLFTLLLCLALPCFSADLVIAEKQSSNYQIVLPDDVGDATLMKYVVLGGRFIQTAIQKATGAQLPLVRESQKAADKPTIYIGDTKALAAAGLSAKDFEQWEHAIVVKGNDIFLYGTDWKGADRRRPEWAPFLTIGSLKAACVFAENFLSTRVVGIDLGNNSLEKISEGVRTLPMETITVPSDYSFRYKPRFLNCCFADYAGLLYMVANNHLYSAGAAFDVHYHVKAIPQDKYYKTHPEYFALIKGRRYYHHATVYDGGGIARPQYCLSNPEVQELIYQEALSRADNGYRVIEFGQTDAFTPCECENCKKMYDTDDWGEKIWLLHTEMAVRLKKERPNVKVAISCYGPTHNPPKSFDKFPVDMIIDLAPANQSQVDAWKSFDIKEMAAWTYVNGNHRACGYSPASCFATMNEEIRFYHSSPIKYLYNCGLFSASSLSGPWIYAWGRWYVNPDEPVEKILHDYCLYGFGEKAAPYFEKFFKLIDDRLAKYPLSASQDLSDFGKKTESAAIATWQARYPADVMAKLVEYFEEGSKLCDEGNLPLADLKTEFEYFRLSANVCNTLRQWVETPTQELRFAIADALEARTNFIDGLPKIFNGQYIAGPGFAHVQPDLLKIGGYMRGVFGNVFDQEPAQLRRVAPNGKAIKVTGFDDPAWEKAESYGLTPLKTTYKECNATFQVAYTDDAFLFKFTSPLTSPVDMKDVKRDCDVGKYNPSKEVFLMTPEGLAQFAFAPIKDATYDSLYAGNNRRGDKTWNCEWSHEDRIEGDVWYSEITIPFKSIGFTLEEGQKIPLQVGFSTKEYREAYGWHVADSGRFADLSGFGKLQMGDAVAK